MEEEANEGFGGTDAPEGIDQTHWNVVVATLKELKYSPSMFNKVVTELTGNADMKEVQIHDSFIQDDGHLKALKFITAATVLKNEAGARHARAMLGVAVGPGPRLEA